MKKSFLFVLIVSFSFCIFSQVDKKPDFRKTYWGMSKDEVKKIETARLKTKLEKIPIDEWLCDHIDYDDVNTLVYVDELFFAPVNLFYYFINDKLYQGKYSYCTSELSVGKSVYKLFKTKLTEKYGKPKEGDPLGPNSEDYYQTAEWKKPNVIIYLFFLGKGVSPYKIWLFYNHPDFGIIYEKKEKDKI